VFDLLSNSLGSSTDTGLSLLFPRRPELRAVQTLASRLGLFRRGEMLMLMPNVFWN